MKFKREKATKHPNHLPNKYGRIQCLKNTHPHAGRYAKVSVRRDFELVGDTGLEPSQDSPEITQVQAEGGAESGAESGAVGAPKAPFDHDLADVVQAWPSLADTIRAGILAMIRAAR